ncbi:hypothetical protein O181_061346 [Austropuccinia psidii MF-1]|uniref:Uncharacterized protein n=1 Tax=Austropuccinia psidii MF-1 TaxID=1389203 RepID=A0A9Q3EML4_9BASI|nr:hypothetical protein [Austropuccinia psidii MF-1]
MVTSLLDQREVIIRPMKDGNGKRTFELGPIVTMSCHPWDSNSKLKQNALNPPRQDSPVQCMPFQKTPWQPTPGPSGTRWSEDLFRETSQHDEPPIPGPSPFSKPPDDIPTREPEPELVPLLPTWSLSLTICPLEPPPTSLSPTPPPSTPTPDLPPIAAKKPTASSPPVPSSSHSYNDARQEVMDLKPKLMIPQAIVHEAINQILLEHCRLLHIISFLDATH